MTYKLFQIMLKTPYIFKCKLQLYGLELYNKMHCKNGKKQK